jgi:CheY-like chemotaxis protein
MPKEAVQYFRGRTVLIVEDDYFLADDMARNLEASGARVIGPVADVQGALDLIACADHVDAAVLDLNLHGTMAFGIADALLARQVPFVFATGYDQSAIPDIYHHVPRCEKPVTVEGIALALFLRAEASLT